MTEEVELKLAIDPADAGQIGRLARLKGIRAERTHLISHYFDSTGRYLWQRGLALRIRQDGGRWIQALKGGGQSATGLHRRIEEEVEVDRPLPDLTRLNDPALARAIVEAGPLQPVFTTSFHRTTWQLDSTEARVEIALDRGTLEAGGDSAQVCEVELELKGGSPAELYRIALDIQRRIPVRLENRSKAERAFALRYPLTPPQPVKAATPPLTREMSVAQAWQSVLATGLAQLEANLQAYADGGQDPEFIHQIRVAARRLRAGYGSFGRVVPAIRDQGSIEGLRWLARQVAPARDWDVFVSEILPPIRQALPELIAPLEAALESAHRQANQAARQAASSQPVQRLLLTLGLQQWETGWQNQPGAADSIRPTARRLLERQHRRLIRQGKNLVRRSPAERHAVRIRAKKLRYLAEFSASLFPKRSADYVQAITALQDMLGELNDRAGAARLLEAVESASPAARQAQGAILGWLAAREEQHLAESLAAWRRFARHRGFWR